MDSDRLMNLAGDLKILQHSREDQLESFLAFSGRQTPFGKQAHREDLPMNPAHAAASWYRASNLSPP